MRLTTALFAAFLVVPIVEVALFVTVGSRIGIPATVAVVVATAAGGSLLVARQGRSAWRRLQRELFEGVFPGDTLAEGTMILLAGALLLTPGFLTDTVGFALLIPGLRRGLLRWASRRATRRWVVIS
ncbi:MAG TPA: FxsA family protein [Actinobacteria bacterium]|nr:FxsA family protein [Actinomycetota bacterium]